MKNKEEVFVAVDSPKVAKKLKKVLKMFNEPVRYPDSIDRALKGSGSICYVGKTWTYLNEGYRKKVTVKELKQILAQEHLKPGDVVIVKNSSYKWVIKLEGKPSNNYPHSLSYNLAYSTHSDQWQTIYKGQFVRYASKSEKELLYLAKVNPVPGKWYKHANGAYPNWLSYYSKDGLRYGFTTEGNWYVTTDTSYFFGTSSGVVEATKKEVEEALFKEAEKRYGKDWKNIKIKAHADPEVTISLNSDSATPIYAAHKDRMWNRNGVIYSKGNWAEALDPGLTLEDYKDKTWYRSTDSNNLIFVDKSNCDYSLAMCDGGSRKVYWLVCFKDNGFHIPGHWREATQEDLSKALTKAVEDAVN